MISVPLQSEHSSAVLKALRKLATERGRVRTTSVLPKLIDMLNMTRAEVDEAVRDLYRANLIEYKPNERELPASGFISITQEEPVIDECRTAWSAALASAAFTNEEVATLAPLSDQLKDLTASDIETLALALAKLRQMDTSDDAGFNVSARYLMGGSKVLSRISKSMLQALNLATRLHNPSPKYIICAGPNNPSATLLIENPRAYENAIRSGLAQHIAIICTFGFGLSYLGQEWLHRADIPDSDKPIVIVRTGTPPALDALIKAPHVFLWADLDRAAVAIYQSLRSAIPQLQFSMIYAAMLPMLKDHSRSHPYATIFEKDGQNIGRLSGESMNGLNEATQPIWNACRHRAVDQEAVDDETILALGPHPLTISCEEFGDDVF